LTPLSTIGLPSASMVCPVAHATRTKRDVIADATDLEERAM
jgi:hypothetical protein